MEIDLKELEGVSLLPLPDGRFAYVDKSGMKPGSDTFFFLRFILYLSYQNNFSGTIYMCGLKEDSLSDELQSTLANEYVGELSDTGDQSETQFVMSNIFSDQVKCIFGSCDS